MAMGDTVHAARGRLSDASAAEGGQHLYRQHNLLQLDACCNWFGRRGERVQHDPERVERANE